MTPGIHTISAQQYRAADGVSKSMLDWITPRFRGSELSGGTPAQFRARWITGEIEDKETEARRIGSITHRCILEPDTMDGAFSIKPDGMNFATSEGRAWRAANGGRPILGEADARAICRMRDAVHTHPYAKRLLYKAQTEQSLFVMDSEGTLRKGRLDALTMGTVIPDLKTCEDASEEAMLKSNWSYRYFVQAAYYVDLCNIFGLDKRVFSLICVEKKPPYLVAVHDISELIEAGRLWYKADLQRYRNCLAIDTWPGHPERNPSLQVPAWAQKELEGIGV